MRMLTLPAQGLADTFILLGMPFDSAEAKQLNKEIFETIYYSALETSCKLAMEQGTALQGTPALMPLPKRQLSFMSISRSDRRVAC